MLTLGTTYLIVKDMQKSIVFYEKLLNRKVTHSKPRSALWHNLILQDLPSLCTIPLSTKHKSNKLKTYPKKYNQAYLNYIQNTPIIYGNNIVLNFFIDNLAKEYQRLKKAQPRPSLRHPLHQHCCHPTTASSSTIQMAIKSKSPATPPPPNHRHILPKPSSTSPYSQANLTQWFS